MYRYILFDLDGTLTDPGLGITNAVMHALLKYGIMVEDRSLLYPFIGPPLKDSFMERYGFSEEKAMEAIDYYREYFSVKGLYENAVYEGITEMLERLKNAGFKILLATSKPEVFARTIMEHFNLDGYFDFIGGALMNETRTYKWEVIDYVLSEMHVDDLSEVLMVGDRDQDVLGARKVGIDCMGVLYGYGDYEYLSMAGAKYFAKKPSDVCDLIMKINGGPYAN